MFDRIFVEMHFFIFIESHCGNKSESKNEIWDSSYGEPRCNMNIIIYGVSEASLQGVTATPTDPNGLRSFLGSRLASTYQIHRRPAHSWLRKEHTGMTDKTNVSFALM